MLLVTRLCREGGPQRSPDTWKHTAQDELDAILREGVGDQTDINISGWSEIWLVLEEKGNIQRWPISPHVFGPDPNVSASQPGPGVVLE